MLDTKYIFYTFLMLVFTCLVCWFLISSIRLTCIANKRSVLLKENGIFIKAEIQRVDRNDMLRSLDSPSYFIVATWKKPITNEVYTFHSNFFLNNPSKYLDCSIIEVLIMEDDPEIYSVDTSSISFPWWHS